MNFTHEIVSRYVHVHETKKGSIEPIMVLQIRRKVQPDMVWKRWTLPQSSGYSHARWRCVPPSTNTSAWVPCRGDAQDLHGARASGPCRVCPLATRPWWGRLGYGFSAKSTPFSRLYSRYHQRLGSETVDSFTNISKRCQMVCQSFRCAPYADHHGYQTYLFSFQNSSGDWSRMQANTKSKLDCILPKSVRQSSRSLVHTDETFISELGHHEGMVLLSVWQASNCEIAISTVLFRV